MRELDRFQNHHISIKYTQILEEWSLGTEYFPRSIGFPIHLIVYYIILLPSGKLT